MIITLALLKFLLMPAFMKLFKNYRTQKQEAWLKKTNTNKAQPLQT